MSGLLNSPILWLGVTIGVYIGVGELQKKFKSPLLNPLLWSIVLIIGLLLLLDVPVDIYREGGSYLSLFVTPATVALAVHLDRNIDYLNRYWPAILTGVFAGVFVHAVLILVLGLQFGFDAKLLATVYPKSITSAMALDLAEGMGGSGTIAVTLVTITGVVGVVIGEKLMEIFKITDPVAQGVSFGVASHALGTSKALELGDVQGAMSSLALITTGITTVLLAPLFQKILAVLG